ncbi:leucine-rich-repeat protein [Thecamonas trahens ATCC 50062]|uniref:Leucine-rich-repeat protein n=1 Tax=Thecamonas trahens ATCC 50062 TaxID=461836 RepID=A0A0L0DNG4_THETB|nr:leucine-rich-repeat protein [Thecamonas trahens ATCC 50062]KNC53800.1 leucine-rich-repeat protein [Thecamonas trahens ATCC 50062]|eukprot:XP_013754360.1 leucine-rich-repeat protein [Thecamonas trahens ATCC 50062]
MWKTYLFGLAAVVLVCGCVGTSALDASEVTALGAMQAQWGKALGWTGSPEDACATDGAWRGLLCYSGHVVNIYLGGYSLSGSLPAAMGGLSHLEGLGMAFNALDGPIPASFANLLKLNVLELSSNALTGTIPASLLSLPSLERLALDTNFLSGSLPAHNISTSLISQGTFDAYRNELDGTIPDWICSMGSNKFDISSNSWSCPQPACCQNGSNSRCGPCL